MNRKFCLYCLALLLSVLLNAPVSQGQDLGELLGLQGGNETPDATPAPNDGDNATANPATKEPTEAPTKAPTKAPTTTDNPPGSPAPTEEQNGSATTEPSPTPKPVSSNTDDSADASNNSTQAPTKPISPTQNVNEGGNLGAAIPASQQTDANSGGGEFSSEKSSSTPVDQQEWFYPGIAVMGIAVLIVAVVLVGFFRGRGTAVPVQRTNSVGSNDLDTRYDNNRYMQEGGGYAPTIEERIQRLKSRTDSGGSLEDSGRRGGRY